jgi:hypothetical protein
VQNPIPGKDAVYESLQVCAPTIASIPFMKFISVFPSLAVSVFYHKGKKKQLTHWQAFIDAHKSEFRKPVEVGLGSSAYGDAIDA